MITYDRCITKHIDLVITHSRIYYANYRRPSNATNNSAMII